MEVVITDVLHIFIPPEIVKLLISFDNGKDFIYERLLELMGIGLELPMQHLYCCALFDAAVPVMRSGGGNKPEERERA